MPAAAAASRMIPQSVSRLAPVLSPASSTLAPIRNHRAIAGVIAASAARPARRAAAPLAAAVTAAVTTSAVTKPWGKEIAVPVPCRPVVSAGSRDMAGAARASASASGARSGRQAASRAAGRAGGGVDVCHRMCPFWLRIRLWSWVGCGAAGPRRVPSRR